VVAKNLELHARPFVIEKHLQPCMIFANKPGLYQNESVYETPV